MNLIAVFLALTTTFTLQANASGPTKLGGMNISKYCKVNNEKGAKLTSGVWVCTGNNKPVIYNKECQWQYKNSNAYAAMSYNNPYSINCYLPTPSINNCSASDYSNGNCTQVEPTVVPQVTLAPTGVVVPTQAPQQQIVEDTPAPTIAPTVVPTAVPTNTPLPTTTPVPTESYEQQLDNAPSCTSIPGYVVTSEEGGGEVTSYNNAVLTAPCEFSGQLVYPPASAN